jgi:hypothetical protein
VDDLKLWELNPVDSSQKPERILCVLSDADSEQEARRQMCANFLEKGPEYWANKIDWIDPAVATCRPVSAAARAVAQKG